MAKKHHSGLPAIMLVDIPPNVRGDVRFRIYLDRECINASMLRVADFREIYDQTVHLWRSFDVTYAIIDGPREVEDRLRDMLRHMGLRTMGFTR